MPSIKFSPITNLRAIAELSDEQYLISTEQKDLLWYDRKTGEIKPHLIPGAGEKT